MAAITWRNVDGPSLGEASPILRAAGESFNAGFSTLDKLLQQRNDVQAKNWEAGKQNNTQAYLDAVAAAKTPAELAALEQSGALAQMAEGFDGQVDKNAIRGALATQLNTLRQREVQTNQHQDMLRTRAEAPIIEQYRILGMKGDNAAQEALVKANPNIKWAEHMAWDRNEEDSQAKRKREQELAPLQHKAAIGAAEDAVTTQAETRSVKALEKEAAAAVQAHQERQRKIGLKLGGIFGANQTFPVRADGTLDLANLTADQHKILEGVAPAEYKQYVMGDTAAADTFVTSLKGKYSPDIVEKAKNTLRAQFNSNTAATLVGRDADNLLVAEAKQQADDDLQRGRLPHEPNSTGAMAIYQKFKPMLGDMIDHTTGLDPEEDIASMSSKLFQVVTQGVDIEGTKVVPSENDIQMAISTAEGGLFSDGTRAGNFEDILIDTMEKNGTVKLIKDGIALNKRDLRRAATSKLNEARQPKK